MYKFLHTHVLFSNVESQVRDKAIKSSWVLNTPLVERFYKTVGTFLYAKVLKLNNILIEDCLIEEILNIPNATRQ